MIGAMATQSYLEKKMWKILRNIIDLEGLAGFPSLKNAARCY